MSKGLKSKIINLKKKQLTGNIKGYGVVKCYF